jgi:hypothetical protein
MIKKLLPYIIGVAILILIGLVIASGKKGRRSFDERVSLRQKDKIPYGTAVTKELLPYLFPNAVYLSENTPPGSWNDLNQYGQRQAIILMSKNFYADEYELAQLMRFVKEGNYVFIIGRNFSEETQKYFGITTVSNVLEEYYASDESDSLQVRLQKPSFQADSSFIYPGKRFDGWITDYDSSKTIVLGTNASGEANFIRLNAGKGSFFIHTSPLVFSNYFILHKNNQNYFSQVFSVLPAGIEKMEWNEYYLTKTSASNNKNKNKSLLEVLMRYPSFRFGLITAILLLLTFVVMEMRRRQRMIPLYQRPRNDSMDFVKTMGRLYHDRRDHGNLARKMGIYFMEHVRSQYKLPTQELNEEFIQSLHYKSGYPLEKLNSIVSFINDLDQQGQISEKQLASFHRQLELFYQNT